MNGYQSDAVLYPLGARANVSDMEMAWVYNLEIKIPMQEVK